MFMMVRIHRDGKGLFMIVKFVCGGDGESLRWLAFIVFVTGVREVLAADYRNAIALVYEGEVRR